MRGVTSTPMMKVMTRVAMAAMTTAETRATPTAQTVRPHALCGHTPWYTTTTSTGCAGTATKPPARVEDAEKSVDEVDDDSSRGSDSADTEDEDSVEDSTDEGRDVDADDESDDEGGDGSNDDGGDKSHADSEEAPIRGE
ncbi:hypothetical protein CBR_g34483 [Chara braunii]|uniref:Uncharacterized protein n=1 Tax=Chara braunii TaxID=69332 RepID=A0A388LIP0_CHABU|nr:hypothetical protein CBR_g34483 [Chara braunii]|eukprot:GBG82200.1 hypothetical protein CBR_g34483 [Chara braunii]